MSAYGDGGLGPHELGASEVPTRPELAHDPNAKYEMWSEARPAELSQTPEKDRAVEHELAADTPGLARLHGSSPGDANAVYIGRGDEAEPHANPVSTAPSPHAASPGQVEQYPPGTSPYPGPGAAGAVPQYSDAPEVVEPDPNEINAILARQAELESQRQTLLRLQSIEEEQQALRARLAQLQQNK